MTILKKIQARHIWGSVYLQDIPLVSEDPRRSLCNSPAHAQGEFVHVNSQPDPCSVTHRHTGLKTVPMPVFFFIIGALAAGHSLEYSRESVNGRTDNRQHCWVGPAVQHFLREDRAPCSLRVNVPPSSYVPQSLVKTPRSAQARHKAVVYQPLRKKIQWH